MDKKVIKVLAVTNGFSLKEQPGGTMDLHPYVYEFAQALLDYRDAELEKQNKYTNG